MTPGEKASAKIINDWLLGALQKLGDEYGSLGVALAAASLTDQNVLIAKLTKRWCDCETCGGTWVKNGGVRNG